MSTLKAEILQRRHRVGQRHATFGLVQLQSQAGGLFALAEIEPGVALARHLAVCMHAERAQPGDVERGFAGSEAPPEGQREGLRPAQRQRGGAARFDHCRELTLDRLAPAAQQGLELRIQSGLVGRGAAVANVENEAQQRQIAAFDLEAPVEHLRLRALFEHRLYLPSNLCRHQIAREPHEGKQMAGERRFDEQEPRTRAVDQAHHRGRDAFDIDFAEADHQIVRQRGQRVDQRFAGVAPFIEIEPIHHARQLGAQPRHVARRGGEPGTGPYAGVKRDRGHLAVFPAPLAYGGDQQVQRDPAMHPRKVVGLDDEQLARVALAVEPFEGPLERGVREHRGAALAANPELVVHRPVAVPDKMAQLGEHPAFEPLQERGALGIGGFDRLCIGLHRGLQFGPVGDCGVDIGHRRAQRFAQLLALAGVDPSGLDIDQRIVIGVVGIAFQNMLQHVPVLSRSTGTTGWSSASMAIPSPATAAAAESTRNGMSGLAIAILQQTARPADRIDRQPGLLAPFHRCGQDEARGFLQLRLVEVRFARKQRRAHAPRQILDQLRGQFGRGFGVVSCSHAISGGPQTRAARSSDVRPVCVRAASLSAARPKPLAQRPQAAPLPAPANARAVPDRRSGRRRSPHRHLCAP